jgi:hypothetical protein
MVLFVVLTHIRIPILSLKLHELLLIIVWTLLDVSNFCSPVILILIQYLYRILEVNVLWVYNRREISQSVVNTGRGSIAEVLEVDHHRGTYITAKVDHWIDFWRSILLRDVFERIANAKHLQIFILIDSGRPILRVVVFERQVKEHGLIDRLHILLKRLLFRRHILFR